jgi:hypothetical protein
MGVKKRCVEQKKKKKKRKKEKGDTPPPPPPPPTVPALTVQYIYAAGAGATSTYVYTGESRSYRATCQRVPRPHRLSGPKVFEPGLA